MVAMRTLRENFNHDYFLNYNFARISRGLLRRIYWALSRLTNKFGVSCLFLDPVNLRGFSVSRMTPSHEIANILRRLRPIETQFSLIRIGNTQDGGYIVPDDFKSVVQCFSAGCDNQWSFERDLYEKFNIPSNIIDEESKRPRDLPIEFTYTSALLGAFGTRGTIKFSDWVRKLEPEPSGDFILQMDIEGYEWESIFEAPSEVLDKFSILIVEFHSVENLRNEKLFKRIYLPTLNKILLNHVAVHIHGNNCCGTTKFDEFEFPRIFEVTFLRKDRINGAVDRGKFSELPNPLDSRNIPDRGEIHFNW